ncbi:bifunctional diaminohydroxyphosphoribosylaminopyrimidine deaminase/5-amino-6-(5-phosphoribosylamino)uracil reductase [soil metagenome]
MAEPDAGTQLTPLGGSGTIDESGLPALYLYPDGLEKCWLRANFIASLDGGTACDGTSGGLAGPGDRALFTVMRELADVIVVGAGTVRSENYGGAQLTVAQRQHRQARGQAEVPPIAIVTNTGHLDRDLKVFTHTEVQALVLTATTAVAGARALLGDTAEVIDCSGDDPNAVHAPALLTALSSRGLRRVLTEGGPRLLGSFIACDLLDELCLTTAPTVVGGDSGRIAAGGGSRQTPMKRVHLLADDAGYLYSRYVRQ